MIGIRNAYNLAANQLFTSNATLATITGFTQPVALGQIINLRGFILLTVGATGGIRFQISIPTGGTSFTQGLVLFNTVAPAVVSTAQTANTVITNALANAGNHLITFDTTFVVGSTAGNVAVQMAQNTSDALSLTILTGSWLETTILNQ